MAIVAYIWFNISNFFSDPSRFIRIRKSGNPVFWFSISKGAPRRSGRTKKNYKRQIVALIWFNTRNFSFRPIPVHPDPEIRFFGFSIFDTYIKSYMRYNSSSIIFFVWPTLRGAGILKKPENRISGSGWTGTGLKKITYIKSYMSYNSYFITFFCMTHPNRGGHTQKTGKPDFRIRMNRDGSEKKYLY